MQRSAEDLLIAVGLGRHSSALDETLDGTRRQNIPVLAITDSFVSDLARNASICLAVPDVQAHRDPPLAPHIVLAQSLVIALSNRTSLEPAA